ncbi:GIY-YIG nuclease family protein [Gammaproteobacteria bacterium]|nr:GIY-YIG nuclease family protein [Gammaproteobacteria bacterium]
MRKNNQVTKLSEAISIAKNFKSRTKFKKEHPSLFSLLNSKENEKVFNEILPPRKIWTKESVLELAKNYTSRTKFIEENSGAYYAAISRLGCHEDLKRLLPDKRGKELVWTKEKIQKVALLYKTRKNFQYSKQHSGAYRRAQRQGWLDDVCKHMEVQLHGYLHCVYVIKNERLKTAYIGITRNKIEKRFSQHRSENNKTSSRSISTLSDTEFIQLTDYLLKPEDVKNIETSYAEEYALLGYKVLNKKGALGALGYSEAIWTFESVSREAKKYNTHAEFVAGSSGAHSAAYRNGWLDEVTSHMQLFKKPRGYWNLEKAWDEAKKYQSRKQFAEGSGAAYDFASRNGYMDQICTHMPQIRHSSGYWSYDRLKEVTSLFDDISDFKREHPNAYNALFNNGLFDELTAHMNKRKSANFWSAEALALEAAKYRTRGEFSEKSESAYKKALSMKIIDSICSHMKSANEIEKNKKEAIYNNLTKDQIIELTKKYVDRKNFRLNEKIAYSKAKDFGWIEEIFVNMPKKKTGRVSKWDIDLIRKEASKYSKKSEFGKRSSQAYKIALKNHWLEDVCSHMADKNNFSNDKKPNNYWSIERLRKEASKYDTRKEFKNCAASAYATAYRLKCLDEICSHMIEIKKPKGYWTFDRVREEALRYSSKSDFLKSAPNAYKACQRNNWFDDVTVHMSKYSSEKKL